MIIATVSAKGSVGKTTVALNLAHALQRDGHATQLIDLDEGQNDLSELARDCGLSCLTPTPNELKRVLDALPSKIITIIECPPRLDNATVRALLLADVALVPVVCEYMVVRGLGRILHSIKAAQRDNETLRIKILPTMFSLPQRDGKRELYETLPDAMCGVSIPRCKHVAAAPAHRQTVLDYKPTSRSATAFRRLAKEVKLWER